MKLNMGKLVQKLMGLIVILFGVLALNIDVDGTGVICFIFPLGLWLLLTKEQLLGDAPEES